MVTTGISEAGVGDDTVCVSKFEASIRLSVQRATLTFLSADRESEKRYCTDNLECVHVGQKF